MRTNEKILKKLVPYKAIYLYKKQRSWGMKGNKIERITCEFLGLGILDSTKWRIKVTIRGWEQIKEIRKHLLEFPEENNGKKT